MQVTVLGCGGSGGVPLVGGIWGACDPADPRNRRRRPSILVRTPQATILIDTSPDLREQLLDAEVSNLDAVLFTHSHADHCHGIDDLRPLVYARGEPIPAFSDPATMTNLTARFDYAFASTASTRSGYSAMLRDHTIPVGAPFKLFGLEITAFEQGHGPITTLGYRIGPVGYSPDAVEIPEAGFQALEGVHLWIVDCLRHEPHPSHAHFARTMAWIRRVAPARAVLTHMNHTMNYADVAAQCPAGVEPGRDNMTIDLADL
ncbi:MBL fold metallo-hydrolase [Rhodovibrio salinarum]|uniref:MBL fold metallo-hydrolase n=2 Tax=Rhodovibrio salinarum TaxID=1087 RepID=A0A934V096_9PROT|nr:MBL fold metallo-hydrolase [Rhodovibrio salinarum]MBK1697992.1 MBL fold metallo-hydrolase [Rhodovibrio salinarum]